MHRLGFIGLRLTKKFEFIHLEFQLRDRNIQAYNILIRFTQLHLKGNYSCRGYCILLNGKKEF